MKTPVTRIFFLSLILLFVASSFTRAQDGPVDHMKSLGEREELLSQKYMSYMSEVAHGGRVKKMEKRRMEVITALKEVVRDASKMRPYKGDASLRDAYKEYWTVMLNMFTEDYGKLVDMEEVAEQSYDAMEAYLLINEKIDEKVDAAYEKVSDAYKSFADNNNVTLVEGEKSKLQKKLGQTGLVRRYENQVFLIFFKSNVQEGNMINALNKGDLNAVEQAKGSMLKYAEEGLTKLDTVKTFKGDGSLITACRKVLDFQKSEADKFAAITDFMIKKEELDKYKKTFDAKPANKRTQSDIDTYNKLSGEYNKMVKAYNDTNNDLNNGRSKVMDNWTKTRQRFLDQHVPRK